MESAGSVSPVNENRGLPCFLTKKSPGVYTKASVIAVFNHMLSFPKAAMCTGTPSRLLLVHIVFG